MMNVILARNDDSRLLSQNQKEVLFLRWLTTMNFYISARQTKVGADNNVWDSLLHEWNFKCDPMQKLQCLILVCRQWNEYLHHWNIQPSTVVMNTIPELEFFNEVIFNRKLSFETILMEWYTGLKFQSYK